MGVFRKKRAVSPSAEELMVKDTLADTAYQDELRDIGRAQFKELAAAHSAYIEQESKAMMQRIAEDMRAHATNQIDALVNRVNTEITAQLNDRTREYSQVTREAQELVEQSLVRNAQLVHEKYQQLALGLQQALASQEVQMATVYQENKTQVATVQTAQEKLLEQLATSEEMTRKQAEQLTQAMRQTVRMQATNLTSVYQENMDRVTKTHDVHAEMLKKLEKTTDALEEQYDKLRELLDESVAKQKQMVSETINDNMAQIVEHYVVAALGEQSDVHSQLPSILRQMDENKQVMIEDMRL